MAAKVHSGYTGSLNARNPESSAESRSFFHGEKGDRQKTPDLDPRLSPSQTTGAQSFSGDQPGPLGEPSASLYPRDQRQED